MSSVQIEGNYCSLLSEEHYILNNVKGKVSSDRKNQQIQPRFCFLPWVSRVPLQHGISHASPRTILHSPGLTTLQTVSDRLPQIQKMVLIFLADDNSFLR